MKRLITTTGILALCFAFSSCEVCNLLHTSNSTKQQEENSQKLCDCNAGVNSSSITGEKDDSYDSPLLGAHAGFSFTLIDFTPATAQKDNDVYSDFPNLFRMASKKTGGFSIRPGISYSQQGSKYTDAGLKGHVRLSYINLPIMLRYKSFSGFFAEAGIQPGLLISARDKYEDNNDDYKDHMNSFDFGAPVGIGYEFKSGFGIGVRVIPGIANIDKLQDGDTDKNRNFVAGFRLFYMLH